MFLIALLREQDADDLAQAEQSFLEGDFKIMQFVRIGTRVINLANVTEIAKSKSLGASGNLTGLVISFVGAADNYATVYEGGNDYDELIRWFNLQPELYEL